ncbi:protein scabrous-like isoform X2 [Drosophila nasuta]|uniref:protein scabrous-like isoform X2 n=1 Tax=Drosophila nasuta TaxID=42062 RepID=UPI00295EA2AA|nr:protein scabrous-like isoform X2 [Drosophila nasuta]
MQSYLKWVIIFCILAPQWTVSIQLNDSIQNAIEENEKKIQKLQAEIEDNEKYLNFGEAINKTKGYISSLEDKLKQCEEQNKNQSESQLYHIFSAIQKIKLNTDTNKNEFKQNDDLINSLKAQIEDKKSLLNDYQGQIKEKGLEIEKLKKTLSAYNNTINKNNAEISNLLSIIGSQNSTIFKNNAQILTLESNITICKESVKKKNAEISRLKSTIESNNSTINKNNADISKLESTITAFKTTVNKNHESIANLESTINSFNSTIIKNNAEISKLKSTVKNNNEIIAKLESTQKSNNSTINKNNAEISKLKSEKINPRATTPQPRITCPSYNNKSQQEITQLKSEANKQTNEIKELKIKLNKSLSNNKNLANSTDENFKKYQNAQISLESCQRNLESLKNESIKNILTVQNLILKAENNQKLLDQCQKNNTDIQKVEQERKSIQEQLNICQNDLKIQKADCSNKDSTIREWRKKADDNQRIEEERNSIISELETCQLKFSNFAEDFKKYEKEQQSLLEKCHKDLKEYIDDCSMKDSTIRDWRKKAEDNQKAEEERNSLQVELNHYKNSYDYFYKRSNALQTNLTDSQHELSKCISLKDAIMRNFHSMKDELNECKPQSTTPSRSLPTSCIGLKAGPREIQLSNGKHLYVICDNDGWIIIQRRMNGILDFNKSWTEYVNGFEDQSKQGEFFIGLENLHLLTKSSRHELYISVTFSTHTYSANYDDFRVGNAESLYELQSLGFFVGKGFDNLRANVHHKFSTYDKKNFNHDCGMGGWWYPPSCGGSNLNGPYNNIIWYYGTGTSAIMKIRPYG